MNSKKSVIIVVYLLSILMFNIIALTNMDKFMQWYRETMDYGNILVAMGPVFIAEFLHICITIIICIILRFAKKVDIKIKKIFYKLPVITIFIWPLILIIASRIIF